MTRVLENARVLVTGAAGFIGMHASRALHDAGAEVVGVDNFEPYYDVALKEARVAVLGGLPRFAFRRVDLADAAATAALFRDGGFSHVVHLAAQPGVRYSLVNPAAYVRNNIDAFGHILEGCRHAAIAHLVYASSSSVYGANHTLPFSEDQPTDTPVSLYAATKKANELMAYSYSHLFGRPATGPALLHCLRAVGKARYVADAVRQGNPGRRADCRIQSWPDAPRLHVCRRCRRRDRAGARAAAGSPRWRAARGVQHRQP
jgi:nucleoside-diphosphate-sugar epimerase